MSCEPRPLGRHGEVGRAEGLSGHGHVAAVRAGIRHGGALEVPGTIDASGTCDGIAVEKSVKATYGSDGEKSSNVNSTILSAK